MPNSPTPSTLLNTSSHSVSPLLQGACVSLFNYRFSEMLKFCITFTTIINLAARTQQGLPG